MEGIIENKMKYELWKIKNVKIQNFNNILFVIFFRMLYINRHSGNQLDYKFIILQFL